MFPQGIGAWEWHPGRLESGPCQPQSFESGNPEAEVGDDVATSLSPLKTPEAGRLPRPRRLPSQAPSWGRKGLPVPESTMQGRVGVGQVLQSAAPAPVRDGAINDRVGERSPLRLFSGTCLEEESRDGRPAGARPAAGSSVSRGAPGRAGPGNDGTLESQVHSPRSAKGARPLVTLDQHSSLKNLPLGTRSPQH